MSEYNPMKKESHDYYVVCHAKYVSHNIVFYPGNKHNYLKYLVILLHFLEMIEIPWNGGLDGMEFAQ